MIANFSIKDKEKVIGYLDNPEVRKLLPRKYRYIRFIWGKQDEETNIGSNCRVSEVEIESKCGR